MTPADEWDASGELRRMAELLTETDGGRLTDRCAGAVMLFVARVCRDVWPLVIDPEYRLAVELAERFWTGQTENGPYADALNAISWPSRVELPDPQTAQDFAGRVARELDIFEYADFAFAMTDARDFAIEAVRRSPRTPKGADYLRPFNGTDLVLCGRLRCLLANPFRAAPAFDPSWRTTTVTAIAAGILADRAFDRLPVLADALDDAGCDAADLLAHARGPGPHLFGCQAVSACLGSAPQWQLVQSAHALDPPP